MARTSSGDKPFSSKNLEKASSVGAKSVSFCEMFSGASVSPLAWAAAHSVGYPSAMTWRLERGESA